MKRVLPRKARRSFLKQKATMISAFYTSNVEQYLRQDGIWGNFCSVAITPGVAFAVEVVPLKPEVAVCAAR